MVFRALDGGKLILTPADPRIPQTSAAPTRAPARQEFPGTMSGYFGSGAAGGAIAEPQTAHLEDLANMPEKEFAAATQGDNWRRLLQG